MASFKAIGDKVIGRMVDGFGKKKTSGGIIIDEKDGDEKSIRPRWFKVTHVGPANNDFKVDEYILVEHGRWTRGFRTHVDDEFKSYMIDLENIMAVSDELPQG